MIIVYFHRDFKKQYNQLPLEDRHRFKERLELFTRSPFHPILNNHPLHGKHVGYRSINIAGDLRAIYKYIKKETVLFIEIGTHNQLYS